MDSSTHSGLRKWTPFERDVSNNCCWFEELNGTNLSQRTIVKIEESFAVVIGRLLRIEPLHKLINEASSLLD